MTAPIGFYVHHHGSGHVTRAAVVARAVTGPVVGFSTLPHPADWPGDWIELPDDAASPGPDADPTAGGILHWAPVGDHPYGGRMRELAAALTRTSPALLHVDVSVEVTMLARLLGIPVSVSVMRGDRSDLPHRLAYDTASILTAPWPRHLPEDTPWTADVLHVGGISRFDHCIGETHPTHGSRPSEDGAPRRVLVLWGHGGGDWPQEVWQRAEASTPGWTWQHGAARDDVWEAMQRADVVVCHAGQNAVAEVAAARRPAVVVGLDRPHDEQAATIAALRAGDLAEVVDATSGVPDLDWPALLEGALDRGGRVWEQWSDGHGAHRVARALDATARGRSLAPRTAVITLVHGRHDHLRGLVAGLAAGTHLPERFVVVAMDDDAAASVVEEACAATGLRPDVVTVDATPEGLPLARARNAGAARAAEFGCERLIFLDVDCIPGPDLVHTYTTAVRQNARPTIWSGPVTYLPPAPEGGYDLAILHDLTDPHPARPAPHPGERRVAEDVRLFWSLSFALTWIDYDRLGGFCEEYVGYGGEDTDVAMSLDAAGGSLVWTGGADAYHQYHPTSSPPVQHVVDIVRNANLFARRWGRHPMEGWLTEFEKRGLVHRDETGAWHVGEEQA